MRKYNLKKHVEEIQKDPESLEELVAKARRILAEPDKYAYTPKLLLEFMVQICDQLERLNAKA